MLTNVDLIFLYGIRQFLNALIHGSQLDFFSPLFLNQTDDTHFSFDQERVEKKNFKDELTRKELKKGTLRTIWSIITNEFIYLLPKKCKLFSRFHPAILDHTKSWNLFKMIEILCIISTEKQTWTLKIRWEKNWKIENIQKNWTIKIFRMIINNFIYANGIK